MEFIEKNKWAIICSIIALILILLGAVEVIINVLFFAAALILGVYIDKKPDMIKEFLKKIKSQKDTKEAEKVEENKNNQ